MPSGTRTGTFSLVAAGVLVEYAEGFRTELVSQGYVCDAAARQLDLMADLSGWLADTGAELAELVSTARVEEFLRARRAKGHRILLSRRALKPLVCYLRSEGAVPAAEPAIGSPMDAVLADYRRYLVSERALAKRSVCAYVDTPGNTWRWPSRLLRVARGSAATDARPLQCTRMGSGSRHALMLITCFPYGCIAKRPHDEPERSERSE